MKLFNLGISLMQRLRFAEKFILVCLLFMVPLSLTSYYLLHDMNRDAAAMEQRHVGLQYLAATNPLLELIAQHRGVRNGILHGDRALISKQEQLDRDLRRALIKADLANQQWGAELEVEEQWHILRQRWVALWRTPVTSQAGTLAAISWQQHSAIIADYLQLIYRVSITSTLFTTGEPVLRHLVEINFYQLPQLIESIGQLRGQGSGLLAGVVVTDEQQRHLLALRHEAQRALHDLVRQWRFAAEDNPSLIDKQLRMSRELEGAVSRYLQLIRQQ
ncbi:MAG: hypothetical protein Q9M13_08180, partial [Mariprofundales bacterium]|nr:hypothetical protein [Mariprofundales bacterium]